MSKLYNLEYLEEISSGDQAFVREMLCDFVKNTPDVLKEIDLYTESADWTHIYKTVHKFIPSFDFIGAELIRNDLRSIEHYAKTQENVEKIAPLMHNIKHFCSDVILELKTDFNL
jgi:hypothetical protein